MNRTLHHVILHQMSVTNDKPHPPMLRASFSKREWDRVLTWLDLSGLAIYFLQRIKNSGAFYTLPEHVRTELERRSADNRERTAGIQREFTVLVKSLEQVHVKYAVLKGVSLLPDYCPDLELRTQYDHDVLVDEASFTAAGEALQNKGYRRKAGSDEGS